MSGMVGVEFAKPSITVQWISDVRLEEKPGGTQRFEARRDTPSDNPFSGGSNNQGKLS